MLRSRPVQYVGLLLLVLACLALIFFPIGPAPQAQDYTVHLTAPQPFDALAKASAAKDKKLAGKTAVQLADTALLAAFPSPDRLPKGTLEIGTDGRDATLTDTATTRKEARDRADRIVAALGKTFPGLKEDPATTADVDKLPIPALFNLGSTAVYPFNRGTGIKLGLDLQGGVSLVLQVRRALYTYKIDKNLVTQDERDAFAVKVRDALAKAPVEADLGTADVNILPDTNQLEIRTQAKDEAQFTEQGTAIDAALKGMTEAKFTLARAPQFFQPKLAPGEDPRAFEQQRLDRTVEIVRNRVDKLGVSEPLIQKQGTSRIVVQLPGETDPQRAVKQIGQTARMEIYLTPATMQVDYTDRNNIRFRDASGRLLEPAEVKKQSQLVVEGDQVKPNSVGRFMDQFGSEPGITFELNAEGAKSFADVTRKVAYDGPDPSKKRIIPIFLDERCISAPTVKSVIPNGQGQISGGFKDLQEAKDLAQLLNSGALPAPIDVIENRTISATLGTDSLRKSLFAGLIGLALVAGYMVSFYRVAGILADCALAVYIVLNLAAFILVGGTLTLPGIAGFLLAIAMSLDTNILVFERLREEMALQPTFAAALRAAFSRAWTAILDSHVTTLIAAAVLFNFGTGPVKGFALTLGIGVCLSLFSAISVTRLFMWSVAHFGETHPHAFGGAVEPTPVSSVSK